MKDEMKENVAILYFSWSDKSLAHKTLLNAAGGTETSVVVLAEQFVTKYNSYVIGNCITHSECGVNYVSAKDFIGLANQIKFKYIVIVNKYYALINFIKKTACSDTVFVLNSLNAFLMNNDFAGQHMPYISNYDNDPELKDPIVKRFIALSEQQKLEYNQTNHIPLDMISIIPNGLDMSLFDGFANKTSIDHNIFWSSSYSRGAAILIDEIAPVVRRTISDFNVILAYPEYCKDKFTHRMPCKILGPLCKRDLYNEMSKHACWWYPSTFDETFCITSVEAAMCGNDLVLPLINGPATTFNEFKSISLTTKYGESGFIEESASRIVDSILNYADSAKVELRNKIRRHLTSYCSIQSVMQQFEKLY